MNIDWKKIVEKFSGNFLWELAAEMSAMWIMVKFFGHQVPKPSATMDPSDPKQVALAAMYHITVGPQSGFGDNAVFARLMSDPRITDRQRDILNDMYALPEMIANKKQKYNDFRYGVGLIAEKFTVDDAVNALIHIGNEPTPEAAYRQAEKDGLLEPADPNAAKKKLDEFLNQIGQVLTDSGLVQQSNDLLVWAKQFAKNSWS